MTIKQLICLLVCCLVGIIIAEIIIAKTKKLGFINGLGLEFIKVTVGIIKILILLIALNSVTFYLAVKVLHVTVTTQNDGRFYVLTLDGSSAWLYLLLYLAVTILVGAGYYFMKKHNRKKLAINGD